MRWTYDENATRSGRALRAALELGCLPATAARVRPIASTSPFTAVPASRVSTAAPAVAGTHAFPALVAANAMKDQGTRPPRDLAALR